MSLSGCGRGPLDPSSTGGTRLDGTRGTDAQGGAPFSISPDGRWLSFALGAPLPGGLADSAETLAQYQLDRLQHFRLLDLNNGQVIRPLVSPEAEALVLAGEFPLLGAGCWTGAHLAIRSGANRYFRLDPEVSPPTWRPFESESMSTRCPFPDRRPPGAGDYGPVRLRIGDDGRVILSDRGSGRQLAIHRPAWLPGMAIQVSYLEVSADGKHVAYGITDLFGSFVGNTTAYSLSVTGSAGAQALAAPVPFLLWAPDGQHLFGYVKATENGASAYAIYRWGTTG